MKCVDEGVWRGVWWGVCGVWKVIVLPIDRVIMSSKLSPEGN